jgi:ribosomal protein S18 acetylase RimI-like enzyme
MSVELRRAAIEDAAQVAEIYLESRKRFLPYAPLAHSDEAIHVWVRETLIPSGGVTVAVVEQRVVGFIAVSSDHVGGWIDHLYLDPGCVSAGLGGQCVELAKAQVPSPIRLYTFQQNEGARRFYRRHGFREVQLTDGASNEEKVPDVLMEWP